MNFNSSFAVGRGAAPAAAPLGKTDVSPGYAMSADQKRELAGHLDEATAAVYSAFREKLIRDLAIVETLIKQLTRERRFGALFKASVVRGKIRAEIKHVDRCAKRSAKIFGGLSRG